MSGTLSFHRYFSFIKSSLQRKSRTEVAEGCRTAGIGCIDCKKVLIRNVFKVLEPIWAKRDELLRNPDIA